MLTSTRQRLTRVVLALAAVAGCRNPSVEAPPDEAAPEEATPQSSAGWVHAVHSGSFLRGEARALSDGGLQVRFRNRLWERVPGITDARAVAGNAKVGCTLRDGGTVTCWSGKDWKDHQWTPEPVVGALEIVARRDDVCARTTSNLICFSPPVDPQSRAGKRLTARQRFRERHAKPGETVAPPKFDPEFDVLPVADAARLVPHPRGWPGLITGDGTLHLELGSYPDPVEAMPPVVGAVHWSAQGHYAAWDEAGVVYIGRRGAAPQANSKLGGVVELVESTEYERKVGSVCARTDAGAVWCWGSNDLGQLGGGTWGSDDFGGSNDFATEPKKVDLPPVTALYADQQWFCAETKREGVWCWGDATRALDWGASDQAAVLDIPPVDQIAGDNASMVCVLRSNEVACSTVPGAGRLFPVLGLPPVSEFIEAKDEVCVRTSGGSYCWSGGFGLTEFVPDSADDSEQEQEPRPKYAGALEKAMSKSEFVQRSVGSQNGLHCGVTNVGVVKCRGKLTGDFTPVALPEPATRVVAAYTGACARLESGKVACWGDAINHVAGPPAVWPTPTQLGQVPRSVRPPVGFPSKK